MRNYIYVIMLGFLIIGGTIEYFRLNSKEIVTTRVTHKERIIESNGEKVETFYLIFTEGGTFKLEDEMIFGNFRSSDWYGDIQIGEIYEFEVVGWRSGFLSMYQNIVKYNHLKFIE
jgi:hypothetical protein